MNTEDQNEKDAKGEREAFKCGDELLPYHPDASHCSPDYRSGWNDCFEAARADTARIVAAEKASRQTAQIENEALKAEVSRLERAREQAKHIDRVVAEAVAEEGEAIRKAMRRALFSVPREQRGSNDILDFHVGKVIRARSAK